MRIPGLTIFLLFAMTLLAGLAYLNRPEHEPAFPERVQGFSFSPYQADQDPASDRKPTAEQIKADLEVLRGRTHAVRTYGSLGALGEVPRLARDLGINVTVGAWVDRHYDSSAAEIARAIELAQTEPNVVRVIIGNEAILRGDVSAEALGEMLERARAAVKQPVSTAEPWHVWLDHPELAAHVDFLAVHILPYWEGVEVEAAVQYSFDRIAELRQAFPGKPIVVTEVGWPSEGRTRESAVASHSNQALFLRRFVTRADAEDVVYYLMEAFDQPWKRQSEGAVGAYWGVFDADRQAKFPFSEPIVRTPAWQALAGISIGLAFALLTVLYAASRSLGTRGRAFLAAVAFATVTPVVWIVYDYTQQYVTPASIATGILLLVGMLGVAVVLMAEAHEWAEAQWARRRLRLGVSARQRDGAWPRVSIHVPAYDEPPEMLIETLDALARLDYPDFEVLVIDNNTPDEATWRPVEAHCRRLGERFRFFHVKPLEGFKAGALNFALRHTDAAATVVAVIDADYVVEPDWLADLVPAFDNPRTAIVQAPQDYRDDGDSAFKAMCHAEYRGFFRLGMVTRNERNAIIQHGTMTMVRRDVLQRLGWAEDCITEDAELGLRIFAEGLEAAYVPDSYGRGVMPDTFNDFRKQRFRWAYGAMQILRQHAGAIFSWRNSPLTAGQRYHFVAGWLPWIADGFNLLFAFAALAWSLAMVAAPAKVDPPLMVFALLPLSLFTFKLAKLVHLYRVRVGAGLRQTAAAALAGLALAHTVGLAVLRGLVTRGEPFFRTPKQAARSSIAGAIFAVREEALMLLALATAIFAVASTSLKSGPDLAAWLAALGVLATPYAAAVIVSVVSATRLPSWLVGTGYREVPELASSQTEPAPHPEARLGDAPAASSAQASQIERQVAAVELHGHQ